ncbi:MAG: sulfotransferase domain-containing protein [Bacteroidia bacterium]|nr:sulfotransferase domain-containing protein [Bacteroidia bacterium]
MKRVCNKKIVWLASYPKSGNTWFRVFLANLLDDSDKPSDINKLGISNIASNRDIFDNYAPFYSSDLTYSEIELLRSEVITEMAMEAKKTIYLKIHDAYTFLDGGRAFIPENVTACAIYIIRNPLDVAVSWSRHINKSIDDTIKGMADENYIISQSLKGLKKQLPQRLLSWSKHVESWTQFPHFPVHIIRYEDIKNSTFETFSKAVKILGLKKSSKQIEKAIRFSDIKEMQLQEKESGFKEKPVNAKTFFNAGEIGTWRKYLSEQQINKIIEAHFNIMLKYGYISDEKNKAYKRFGCFAKS